MAEEKGEPGKGGRPTLLTPALQEAIATDVESGAKFEDAAVINGITERTLYNWIARGENGEEPFLGFFQAITRARAVAKLAAIKNVRAGVLPSKELSPDWKAEAWFLERTFPHDYGPNAVVHTKVEGELNGALDRLQQNLAPDVYNLVLAALSGQTSRGEAPVAEDGPRVVVKYSDGIRAEGSGAESAAEPSAPGTPTR